MSNYFKMKERFKLLVLFVLVSLMSFSIYRYYTLGTSSNVLFFWSIIIVLIFSLFLIRFWFKQLTEQTNQLLDSSDLLFVVGVALLVVILFFRTHDELVFNNAYWYSYGLEYGYEPGAPTVNFLDYLISAQTAYFTSMFAIRTLIQRYKSKRYNNLLLHGLNNHQLSFYIKSALVLSLVGLFITNLILSSYFPWSIQYLALIASVLILVSLQFNYLFYLVTDTQTDFNRMTLPPYIQKIQLSRKQNDLRVLEIVEEKMRAEKFKTDLITNVSHDIKTPLTSIINYVDLLKQLPIEDPQFNEYVEVLHQKGFRLKSLIDDLIEASKVGSGNVELDITSIDFVELVNQAYSEVDERFQNNELSYVVEVNSTSTLVQADGRYLYRVLENVLVNIDKYSMAKTRVYATFFERDEMMGFEIKNISSQALNIDPRTLMEQFVRGDASRSAEGHGLGLYIASSLVQLMHGELTVSINGDLFIVTILLPKSS